MVGKPQIIIRGLRGRGSRNIGPGGGGGGVAHFLWKREGGGCANSSRLENFCLKKVKIGENS